MRAATRISVDSWTKFYSAGEGQSMESALAGKAALNHAHAQSDITGLTTALSGKASSSHTHAQSDITGLITALNDLTTALNSKAATAETGYSINFDPGTRNLKLYNKSATVISDVIIPH